MNDFLIYINGKEVSAKKGETILEVATRNNIFIPTLCHDKRLEPYSSCFVCVVEVEGMKGMQPSCSTKVVEEMKIHTDNEKVRKARKTALDLLVSNHYADCAAPCKGNCPAGVDVQGYISLIDKGLFSEAIGLIKEVNPLPAICGRVCVRPCEVACRRNLMDEGAAVGIDYLKRFAADKDLESDIHFKPKIEKSTGKKVAIIGAGPGGLSAAYFLQQKGHQCDIFEAAPYPGGWLRYGIPEYRLPNDLLDKEISTITEIGVNIFCNKKLGDNLSYKEIAQKYDSTILTIGSQKGALLGAEGEDADGVYSGIDFLKNMEVTGQKYDFKGKKIAVVGGGNTAMDCCRTSVRCGSTNVVVIYRRTEKEMPANPIEIHESKLEGVEYLFLHNPVRVNKDENGKVKSMTLQKMALGEPDASGRRRPVPVEGSEIDMEFDYILAAIGQKTDVNFLNDINSNTQSGELKATRWGDIEANPETLQTGIESIFAAGDGVTGPATIIKAIAQAKIAANSCNQYLNGQKVETLKKEFLSKKDNFKEQKIQEYKGKVPFQKRQEMPVLDANQRFDFKEVELGYSNEQATQETKRCLECGCVEYFDCDLKNHCTEYNAEQKKFAGEFKEYPIRNSHPFIKIDNNKCILCSRCVRICKDIVGANALGLVERGFETFVAPSMNKPLEQTDCESCGLCISACPTGAITEKTPFKPGPVKLETFETICNYCSIGCKITIHHKGGFVMKVTGADGLVNKDGNLCKNPKFGYHYFNDIERITKPLLKKNGAFTEISFDEAFNLIENKIKNVKPNDNLFFAGARLTNEELYMLKKLAYAGVKTNNINSFHYLGKGLGYLNNSKSNLSFNDLNQAKKVYIIGSEPNNENAVFGFMLNSAKYWTGLKLEMITVLTESKMFKKVEKVTKIKSYYNFIKAVNHYIISNNLFNKLYIDDNCSEFVEYKNLLLSENYTELVNLSGVENEKVISGFAKEYVFENNAVIVYSENQISSKTSIEIYNLALLTGKLGKTGSGLISLKGKNNSHGLFDMGIFSELGIGNIPADDKIWLEKTKKYWNCSQPEKNEQSCLDMLENNTAKNIFIFGEDPVGTAFDKEKPSKWIDNAEFVVVQDYFMTETCSKADLILPASFPTEIGGSFTNTQKNIQNFDKYFNSKLEKTSIEQFSELHSKFGLSKLNSVEDIFEEVIKMLPEIPKDEKFELKYTQKDNPVKLFKFGCDNLKIRFEKYFK